MARAPVQPASSPIALRPVASPVDTFVAPGPSPLRDMAQSLGVLDRGLNDLLDQRAAKQKETDTLKADADFIRNNEAGYAEGVQKGLIPPQASPFYMRRYKLNEGEAMGRRLRSDFLAQWDGWSGKNSDDPAAFDAFYGDFIRANVPADADPEVLAGLAPSVRQLGAEAYDTHTRFRTQQVREGSLRAELAGVNGTLDDAHYDGLAYGNGMDTAASADAIERQREAYMATGGTGEDFDKNAMGLVAAKAVELGEPGLLDFFKRTVPGTSYTYGETPEGAELRRNAIEQLEEKRRQAVVLGDKAAEAERKANLEAAQRATITAMVEGKPISEEDLAAGEKADPLFRTKVGEWRDNLAKGERNPTLRRQIEADILAGGGVQAVIRAAPSITSSEDLNSLLGTAKSFEGARASVDDILGTTSARNVLGILDTRTKAEGSFTNPIVGMTDEGLEAQHDFRMMVARWAMENPDASVIEREEAIAKIGKLLVDRLQPADDGSGVSTYERDASVVGDLPNPYTERRPEEPTAEPVSGTPTAPATQEDDRSTFERLKPDNRARDAGAVVGAMALPTGASLGLKGEDAAFYDMFSADEQGTLQATAKRLGKPLAEVVQHVRQKGAAPAAPKASAPDGTPIDPVAYRPDEADEGGADARLPFTREMAEAILQAVMEEPEGLPSGTRTATAPDARAAHLLDLIGKHEAAGNYNAVFGNAGSKRDLSAFTLDQILGQQQAARRRGVASTAIGRYQFIYKTLRGLRDELGLSGSERFTPELQDRLGMALLERRGWSAFRAGKLSMRQFAVRLGQEWASLPDPRTGRSFYHGDGLNAAGTSTQAVYAALGFEPPLKAQPASLTAYAPTTPQIGSAPKRDPYANIPEAERDQFRQWNSDPVANHEANLGTIDQSLAGVVRRAQELTGVRFVVGSGKRDDALQRKAVEWGWSKTHDSDHEHGGAVDLWPLDDGGAVKFDPKTQAEIVKAMKQAARELGVELDVGADWKTFKDNPHFALKGRSV